MASLVKLSLELIAGRMAGPDYCVHLTIAVSGPLTRAELDAGWTDEVERLRGNGAPRVLPKANIAQT